MRLLSESSVTKLIEYILYHEDDIAYGMNDFDDLMGIFTEIFGRLPEKEPKFDNLKPEALKASNYICQQIRLRDKG